jgi:putative hydrolase of the HAD superfamily
MLDGIRWVLFDAVGTLMYADPPVAEVYHEVGGRYGSRLCVREIDTRFRAALARPGHGSVTNESWERERWRLIVRETIVDIPHRLDAVFEELWHHFAQPRHWRLYDDVPGAVSELARRGFQLGIASNFDRRLIEIVQGHPPLSVFTAVFPASAVGYTKPTPAFFREIEKRLGVPPEQVALVGDDEASDAQGAIAAGWRAVRLNRSGTATVGEICSLTELIRAAG